MLSPRTWKTPTIHVFRVNIYLKKVLPHHLQGLHRGCLCFLTAALTSQGATSGSVPHGLPMGSPLFLWVPPVLPLQPPLPSRSLHSRPADGSGDGAPLQVPHCWCPSPPQYNPLASQALPASPGPPSKTQESLLCSIVATKSFTELLHSTMWLPGAPMECSLCSLCA